jgi:long-chain acyl-CoA synthetase
MTGYLNAPEATREVMRDGTFHTGDVGFFDKEGYLYISGRKNEIIIVHGFNVLPTEVESVLFIHQDVQEAAVVGEPDPHSGERVMAFVVRKPGATVTADELIALARNQLASYKVPRDITFVDVLPKTSVGKVDRAALRGEKQSSRPD